MMMILNSSRYMRWQLYRFPKIGYPFRVALCVLRKQVLRYLYTNSRIVFGGSGGSFVALLGSSCGFLVNDAGEAAGITRDSNILIMVYYLPIIN